MPVLTCFHSNFSGPVVSSGFELVCAKCGLARHGQLHLVILGKSVWFHHCLGHTPAIPKKLKKKEPSRRTLNIAINLHIHAPYVFLTYFVMSLTKSEYKFFTSLSLVEYLVTVCGILTTVWMIRDLSSILF